MAAPEAELKLLFAKEHLTKVKAAVCALPNAQEGRLQHLHATYFDTPRQDLWAGGFILRVRAEEDKYIQTVKHLMPSSIQRDEREAEIAGPKPDLALAAACPLGSLMSEPAIGRALRPAFDVDVSRTPFSVACLDGKIEASLDQGAIRAHGEILEVHELEIELKSGVIESLFKLARLIQSQAPLQLSVISKAERGHLLAGGTFGRAVKGSQPRLEQAATCAAALKEICRTCLHDFQINLPAVRSADHVEGVHQARIALRRLRAALTFFKPILAHDRALRGLRGEFKWLAGLLGAVRDLDVLQANLLVLFPYEAAGNTRLEPSSHCDAKRKEAYQTLIACLDSERGRELFLTWVEWAETGAWQRESTGAQEPLVRFVRHEIKRRWRKLVNRGANLLKADAATRHRIRIEAKRLRYIGEFFSGAPDFDADRDDLKLLIRHTEGLQDALGSIRDEEAMTQFLESKAWRGSGVAPDGKMVIELCEARRKEQKKRSAKELKTAVRAHAKLTGIGW